MEPARRQPWRASQEPAHKHWRRTHPRSRGDATSPALLSLSLLSRRSAIRMVKQIQMPQTRRGVERGAAPCGAIPWGRWGAAPWSFHGALPPRGMSGRRRGWSAGSGAGARGWREGTPPHPAPPPLAATLRHALLLTIVLRDFRSSSRLIATPKDADEWKGKLKRAVWCTVALHAARISGEKSRKATRWTSARSTSQVEHSHKRGEAGRWTDDCVLIVAG